MQAAKTDSQVNQAQANAAAQLAQPNPMIYNPAPDLSGGSIDSLIYSHMHKKLVAVLLSYGKNEQQALHNFYLRMHYMRGNFLESLAFPKTDIESLNWEAISEEFFEVVYAFDPVDYEDQVGGIIVYTADQVATLFLNVYFFRKSDYATVNNVRANLERTFRQVAHVIQQKNTDYGIAELFRLYKPLNDLLEVLTVYKSQVENEYIPGPEKAAA